MGTITFDTLKFTKRLKEAGFTKPQAEVATKRDLERLEAKLVGELTLVKWMLGVLLGGVLALVLKTFFPS